MMYGKRWLRIKDSFKLYYPKEKMKAMIEMSTNKNFYDEVTGGIYK